MTHRSIAVQSLFFIGIIFAAILITGSTLPYAKRHIVRHTGILSASSAEDVFSFGIKKTLGLHFQGFSHD